MGIDITRIPALEYELEQSKGTKPGGQPPRKDRIAAIEEELRIHRRAAEAKFQSERRAAGIVNAPRKARSDKETAVAEPAPENADTTEAPAETVVDETPDEATTEQASE